MKRFTLRLKDGLYKQLKDYAETNDFTLVGAVRFIIHHFFQVKKIKDNI